MDLEGYFFPGHELAALTLQARYMSRHTMAACYALDTAYYYP